MGCVIDVSKSELIFPLEDSLDGSIELYEPALLEGDLLDKRLENSVIDSGVVNPFDYQSSQVRLAKQKAYGIINDGTFAMREALALIRESGGRMILSHVSKPYQDKLRAAVEKRFDDRVAPTIASTMASLSFAQALFSLGYLAPDASTEESIRLTKSHIDTVDLCELQIYNTVNCTAIKDSYVNNVAPRVERILSRV